MLPKRSWKNMGQCDVYRLHVDALQNEITALRTGFADVGVSFSEYSDGVEDCLSFHKAKNEKLYKLVCDLELELDKRDNAIELHESRVKLMEENHKKQQSAKDREISVLSKEVNSKQKTIEKLEDIRTTQERARISIDAANEKSEQAYRFKENKKQ